MKYEKLKKSHQELRKSKNKKQDLSSVSMELTNAEKKLLRQKIDEVVEYVDRRMKEESADDDNDPIGLILSAEKDDVTVEYALGGISNKLFVSKYQVYLPKKEELEAEMRKLLE